MRIGSFNTDGAEALRGLHVEDTKIWTSGEYMFNYYIDTKVLAPTKP